MVRLSPLEEFESRTTDETKMMPRMKRLIACVGVMVATTGQVAAGVIYSQPLRTNPSGSFGANSNWTGAENQQIADDFQLTAPATVTGVDWFGSYHDGSTPGAKSFLVRFFSESLGVATTQLFEETVSIAGINTGFTNSGPDPIMKYSSTLATPFSFQGSTTYYISILEADSSTSSTWTWSFADGNGGINSRVLDSGLWGGSSLVDMAFSLNSETATVPEPSSLAIFGLGTLGLVGIRRRKQKRSSVTGKPRVSMPL